MQPTPKLIHLIIEYALYAFAVLTVSTAFMFSGKQNFTGENVAEILRRSEVAKLATIILIVAAASFSGLLGIIEGQAVVAILSGIAGYVLGDRGRSRATDGGE